MNKGMIIKCGISHSLVDSIFLESWVNSLTSMLQTHGTSKTNKDGFVVYW